MPPKRKSTRARRPPPTNISTAHSSITEAELADAFNLFAVPRHTVPTLSFSDDEDATQPSGPRRRRADDDDEDPDEPVLKIADVRRALAAVDLPRPPADFFDKGERCVGREHFVMLGVTLAETAGDGADEDSEDDEAFVADDGDENLPDADEGGGGFVVDDENAGGFVVEDDDEEEELAGGFERPKRAPATSKTSTPSQSKSKVKGKEKGKATEKPASGAKRKRGSRVAVDEAKQQEDIDHAFALFTHGRSLASAGESAGTTGQAGGQHGTTAVITMADLRRVARELREDVDEQTLRAMMEEAGATAGRGGQGMVVGREEFESVMKRAGVFA